MLEMILHGVMGTHCGWQIIALRAEEWVCPHHSSPPRPPKCGVLSVGPRVSRVLRAASCHASFPRDNHVSAPIDATGSSDGLGVAARAAGTTRVTSRVASSGRSPGGIATAACPAAQGTHRGTTSEGTTAASSAAAGTGTAAVAVAVWTACTLPAVGLGRGCTPLHPLGMGAAHPSGPGPHRTRLWQRLQGGWRLLRLPMLRL